MHNISFQAIMSQRTSDGAEHEGSRRMKTELLVQVIYIYIYLDKMKK